MVSLESMFNVEHLAVKKFQIWRHWWRHDVNVLCGQNLPLLTIRTLVLFQCKNIKMAASHGPKSPLLTPKRVKMVFFVIMAITVPKLVKTIYEFYFFKNWDVFVRFACGNIKIAEITHPPPPPPPTPPPPTHTHTHTHKRCLKYDFSVITADDRP